MCRFAQNCEAIYYDDCELLCYNCRRTFESNTRFMNDDKGKSLTRSWLVGFNDSRAIRNDPEWHRYLQTLSSPSTAPATVATVASDEVDNNSVDFGVAHSFALIEPSLGPVASQWQTLLQPFAVELHIAPVSLISHVGSLECMCVCFVGLFRNRRLHTFTRPSSRCRCLRVHVRRCWRSTSASTRALACRQRRTNAASRCAPGCNVIW